MAVPGYVSVVNYLDSVMFQSPTQINTQPTSGSTKNGRRECTTDLIESAKDASVGQETTGGINEAEQALLKNLPGDVVSLVKDILADATRRHRKATLGRQTFWQPPYQRLNRSWSQTERDVLFNVLDCSGDEAYYATNQVCLGLL